MLLFTRDVRGSANGEKGCFERSTHACMAVHPKESYRDCVDRVALLGHLAVGQLVVVFALAYVWSFAKRDSSTSSAPKSNIPRDLGANLEAFKSRRAPLKNGVVVVTGTSATSPE